MAKHVEVGAFASSLARSLVFLQRVYILGPRTNLQLENSHGESQEEGQEKGRKEEVTRR
jgi:hypothetical protein